MIHKSIINVGSTDMRQETKLAMLVGGAALAGVIAAVDVRSRGGLLGTLEDYQLLPPLPTLTPRLTGNWTDNTNCRNVNPNPENKSLIRPVLSCPVPINDLSEKALEWAAKTHIDMLVVEGFVKAISAREVEGTCWSEVQGTRIPCVITIREFELFDNPGFSGQPVKARMEAAKHEEAAFGLEALRSPGTKIEIRGPFVLSQSGPVLDISEARKAA